MDRWEGRANNFDCMRLALAALVIYSHAYPLGAGPSAYDPLERLTHGQSSAGGFAVDCFFIMSGFLITGSVVRSSGTFSFLKRRALRIYPGFVVSALLMACVVLPLSHGHLPETTWRGRIGDFVWHTLRLSEFQHTGTFPHNPLPNALNGSIWSIFVEFWCYLLVAGLAVTGALRKRWLVAAMFVAAWLTGIYFRYKLLVIWSGVFVPVIGPWHIWAHLLPLYLAGVVFYSFQERIARSAWLAAVCALSLVVTHVGLYTWALVFPVAGTYLLFWLAYAPWIRLQRIGRFGDFSYGTYLYGFPIEQLVMQAVGHPVAAWKLTSAAVPLALLAGVASWYGVERHFLQPSRRKESVVHALHEEAALL